MWGDRGVGWRGRGFPGDCGKTGKAGNPPSTVQQASQGRSLAGMLLVIRVFSAVFLESEIEPYTSLPVYQSTGMTVVLVHKRVSCTKADSLRCSA